MGLLSSFTVKYTQLHLHNYMWLHEHRTCKHSVSLGAVVLSYVGILRKLRCIYFLKKFFKTEFIALADVQLALGYSRALLKTINYSCMRHTCMQCF